MTREIMDTTMTSAAQPALDRAVAQELAAGGELQSQAGTNAVILRGKKVNHILHLILSLLTAGLWLIVWLLLIFTNKRQRIVLTATEDGQVQRTVVAA